MTFLTDVEAIASSLVEMWLQPRRHWLKKREPRVAYVRTMRTKITNGIARPFQMLLAGAFADVDDGAPLAVVLQPWYAVIGMLRDRAAARDRAKGKSWEQRVFAINQREQDAEAALTKAQLRVAANPNDVASLVAKKIAMREYRAVLDEMEALIDERLAVQGQAA